MYIRTSAAGLERYQNNLDSIIIPNLIQRLLALILPH